MDHLVTLEQQRVQSAALGRWLVVCQRGRTCWHEGCLAPRGNHLAGIDSSERIWISSAGATIWEQVGIAHGAAHAITVTDSGALLIVDDSGVTLLPAPSS